MSTRWLAYCLGAVAASLQLFTITPNRNRMDGYYADEGVDKHLHLRARVTAGPHVVGATFVKKRAALVETERQPYVAHFNMNRHPRRTPAVHSVSITGPFDAAGAGTTPSRDRIFTCRPSTRAGESDCTRRIVSAVARRAYRRPVTDRDMGVPLRTRFVTIRRSPRSTTCWRVRRRSSQAARWSTNEAPAPVRTPSGPTFAAAASRVV